MSTSNVARVDFKIAGEEANYAGTLDSNGVFGLKSTTDKADENGSGVVVSMGAGSRPEDLVISWSECQVHHRRDINALEAELRKLYHENFLTESK